MDAIMEIADRRGIPVLEDCAQCAGGRYKGKYVGTIGDLGINSFQLSKTITAGEGGAVVTSDAVLFERACRFHDVGSLSRPHQQMLGETKLMPFVGTNFRMSEFTGGVMLVQLRKLDKIIGAARANAALVYEGIRDLPGLRPRLRPDPAGDLGSPVFIGFESKEQRERYTAAMRVENVPAGPPGGSVILPIVPYIENKVTIHPAWPTWTSERGRAIRYGAACCPRTIDILSRFAGVAVGPKYPRQDVHDVIAAIRKVHPKIVRA
jgi:8-amino-3,8-dideoxy-alpha-D-manno-octulosonate transaminase